MNLYNPINGWTKRKIINHMKKHFKGQSISKLDNDTCLYRGPSGKKCAVGLFIPDDKYKPDMENKTVRPLMISFPEIVPFMPLENDALCALQNIHDRKSDVKNILNDMITWIKDNVKE